MPHVVVKLYAGRSDELERRVAAAVTEALVATGSTEASVSVALEDVAPEDWVEAVFRPDIVAKPDTTFKQPGYDPFGR